MLKEAEREGVEDLWMVVDRDPGAVPHPARLFQMKVMQPPGLPMRKPELEAAAEASAGAMDPEVVVGLARALPLASRQGECTVTSLDILALTVRAAVVEEDKLEVTTDLVVMGRAVAPARLLAPPTPSLMRRMPMRS
jgi:hypothetical protein